MNLAIAVLVVLGLTNILPIPVGDRVLPGGRSEAGTMPQSSVLLSAKWCGLKRQ